MTEDPKWSFEGGCLSKLITLLASPAANPASNVVPCIPLELGGFQRESHLIWEGQGFHIPSLTIVLHHLNTAF